MAIFGNKKKWTTDTCYKRDKPWKHYAIWMKAVTKDHILYNSICMKCLEQANSRRQKVDWWLIRRLEGWLKCRGFILAYWNVLKLSVVMVTQLHEYTESNWTVHFYGFYGYVKLYLNKAVFKKENLVKKTQKAIKEILLMLFKLKNTMSRFCPYR